MDGSDLLSLHPSLATDVYITEDAVGFRAYYPIIMACPLLSEAGHPNMSLMYTNLSRSASPTSTQPHPYDLTKSLSFSTKSLRDKFFLPLSQFTSTLFLPSSYQPLPPSKLAATATAIKLGATMLEKNLPDALWIRSATPGAFQTISPTG
jgi:hypothetical protein